MIPSEEARQTRKGIKKYFEFQGERIEFSDLSDDNEGDEDGDDEEEPEFMEDDEGLDIDGIE